MAKFTLHKERATAMLRLKPPAAQISTCAEVPKIGESVEEVLRADLELENEAVPLLKKAIAHCEKARDYVSRDLFASILENEEEHIDTLERQFDMISRMGIENYVQLQSKPAEEWRDAQLSVICDIEGCP